MPITITYRPARQRARATIHAWDLHGTVTDLTGELMADGISFQFTLQTLPDDPREISFKLRFPGEPEEWEPDDFIRTVPTRHAEQLWIFDFSPRCLEREPRQAAPFTAVSVHAISERKFRDGAVYVWVPEDPGSSTELIAQSRRDEASLTSTFTVPLTGARRNGFHFKLVGRDREQLSRYEPDYVNRVWRPSDGSEVWIKSGQVDVRPEAIARVSVPVDLVFPSTFETPSLLIRDQVDDYSETLPPQLTPLEAEFTRARFDTRVYPGATYTVRATTEPLGATRRFRIPLDSSGGPSITVHGYDQWLATAPEPGAAQAEIIIHPNPSSTFGHTVTVALGIGAAGEHKKASAQRRSDGTWVATVPLLPDIPYWAALDGESRPDGPLNFRRGLRAPAGPTTRLHTIDGVGGFSDTWRDPFAEVSPSDRRRLMTAAFGSEIASANIFRDSEMPHGSVEHGGQRYFVACAPHAMDSSVLLMPALNQQGTPRDVREERMRLTPDLRYWWCAVPASDVPHGTYYRFRVKDGRELLDPGARFGEILDPASRWARDTGRLSVRAGSGGEESWSRIVAQNRIEAAFAGSQWRTPGWEYLLVYEMHPLRFTQRNQDGNEPLCAFAQIAAEFRPGRYLDQLPVTALELMPVHEFPGDRSWGYNPSLFFAVDSLYGGPEQLANCVRTCHEAGRAVLLDLVLNHMTESPLQELARDVYADGETAWGDMVDYDHPASMEFFRQSVVYLWRNFRLDGFRFDATEAIVNGHLPNDYIIKRDATGRSLTGSGGGWEFLGELRSALERAAQATGQSWPYLVGENDPNNWGMSQPGRGVLDGQWHFAHHYPLAGAAENRDDRAGEIRAQTEWPQPFYQAVRFAESHDSTSSQGGKQRIARREAWGNGREMAKAIGTAALLARGVPMLFMGEEAAEDRPFGFDMKESDPEFVLRLDDYERQGDEFYKVLTWFRHLMGLRNNPANGLRGEDEQIVRHGNKTLAFTRGAGKFFVVTTFGTSDGEQNLGWLGLPTGSAYKEVFNSTWNEYRVHNERQVSNGGYNGRLRSGDIVRLPSIGAVVLERV